MKKVILIIVICLFATHIFSQNIITRKYSGVEYQSILVGPDSNIYLMDSKKENIRVVDKNGITINTTQITLNNPDIGNGIEVTDTSVLVFKQLTNGQFGIVEYNADLSINNILKTFPSDTFFSQITGNLGLSKLDNGGLVISALYSPSPWQSIARVLNANFTTSFSFNYNGFIDKIFYYSNKIYFYTYGQLSVYNKTSQTLNNIDLIVPGNGIMLDLIIQNEFVYFYSRDPFKSYLTKYNLITNTVVYNKSNPLIHYIYTPRFVNVSNQNKIGVTLGHVIYQFNKSNGALSDSIQFINQNLSVIAISQNTNKNVTINKQINSTPDNIILTVFDDNFNKQTCNLSKEPICFVSVDKASGKNKINWGIGEAIEYNVYREKSIAGVYELIGKSNSKTVDYFIDTLSNPLKQSNRYVLTAKYECGVTTPYSLPHKTIHLSASPNTTGGINLIWDGYSGFDIGTYYIYRGSQPDSMILIDSIQASLNSYTDLKPQSNLLYYEIRARKYGNCTANIYYKSGSFLESVSNRVSNSNTGINDIKNSNIKIYPNPTNNIINIEGLNKNENNTIQIFDVQGKLVFTKTINEKGMIDLSELNKGVYVIKIGEVAQRVVKM